MLPLSYYNQRQTGQIMSRVTGDLQRLQDFISEGFQQILVNIVTMLLIASILLMMNWKLFCLALAPVPIIALATWLFGHYIHLLYHRIWRRYAGLQAILTDTIPGIRVVKAFAQERRESVPLQRLQRRAAEPGDAGRQAAERLLPLAGPVDRPRLDPDLRRRRLVVIQAKTVTLGTLIAFMHVHLAVLHADPAASASSTTASSTA